MRYMFAQAALIWDADGIHDCCFGFGFRLESAFVVGSIGMHRTTLSCYWRGTLGGMDHDVRSC